MIRVKIEHAKKKQLEKLAWKLNDNSFPRNLSLLCLDMVNTRLNMFTKRNISTFSNYIKINFQSKDLEKIGVPSIIKKYESLLPVSIFTQGSPSVIFTLTRSIGSEIFNYKSTVKSVITNGWKKNEFKCDCHKSVFKDPFHNHVVTGDLRTVSYTHLTLPTKA